MFLKAGFLLLCLMLAGVVVCGIGCGVLGQRSFWAWLLGGRLRFKWSRDRNVYVCWLGWEVSVVEEFC